VSKLEGFSSQVSKVQNNPATPMEKRKTTNKAESYVVSEDKTKGTGISY
jgi:hypothetical protein